MQVRQRRFADLDRGIDALAVQRAFQRRLDALAHFGAEAVARQVDEARIEAPVLVAANEKPRARALLQREDAGRGRVELFLGALEQLVARLREVYFYPAQLKKGHVERTYRPGQ